MVSLSKSRELTYDVTEQFIASWIREVTGEEPSLTPDNPFCASEAIVDEQELEVLTGPMAFSYGARFGVRIAMAVLEDPSNAERAVRKVIAESRADVVADANRERAEARMFAKRRKAKSPTSELLKAGDYRNV